MSLNKILQPHTFSEIGKSCGMEDPGGRGIEEFDCLNAAQAIPVKNLERHFVKRSVEELQGNIERRGCVPAGGDAPVVVSGGLKDTRIGAVLLPGPVGTPCESQKRVRRKFPGVSTDIVAVRSEPPLPVATGIFQLAEKLDICARRIDPSGNWN